MAGNTLENMDKSSFSPMMQKYLETKEKYKDCILFYRLGDFYEMFFEDALIAARELEITLTGKDCGLPERAPMAGIPHHAAEVYAEKLIEKGYKVAICEQLEDPKEAKGIVKRGVIRILTPGTIVESNLLEEKKNNYNKFYKEHKDERKEYYKEHYEKNKEERQKYYRDYYARKKVEKENKK